MDGDARTGELSYYDNLPAWTMRVPQPRRFQGVEMKLDFSAFLLPNGGLLAGVLRLYDIPDQPFYVHRVFDPTDMPVAEYLRTSLEALYWIVEIQSAGQDCDVFRVLSLKDTGFTEGCKRATAHNRRLGQALDGESALEDFLDAFDPAVQEGGWEAGWAAVRKKFKLKKAPR